MTDAMASFADWMSNLNEKLTEIPLSQLAVPGSHNAMAYSLDVNSSVLEPKKLKSLDKMFSAFLRPIVKKWGTVQEKTISEQLEAGVRYFDLRVAGKPESSDLFFYHGLYTTMTVEPSLKDCWEKGYQVVLSYDKSGINDDPFLWPPIEYWWADDSDPQKVISYLNNQKQKGRPDGFFVAGLNLTFDGNDMLLYLLKSLKEKTMSAYPLLLDWVKEQHRGSDRESINIFAGDYVGMNSFIQDVIRLNSADKSSLNENNSDIAI